MRGFLVVALGLTWLSACFNAPDLAASQICSAYCGCNTVIRTQTEACIDACEAQIGAIPEACVACAEEASCTELEPCLDLCFETTEAP